MNFGSDAELRFTAGGVHNRRVICADTELPGAARDEAASTNITATVLLVVVLVVSKAL